MPPKLIIEVLGDTSNFERSLNRSTGLSKRFSKQIEGSARGALSASGAFQHLGRSLAFASGGFVAFASAGEALRSSIDAARDADVAQRSLAAQLKASGQSFAAAKGQIDKAELSVGKFGFTTEDSAAGLVVLERATDKISRAIALQGIEANLARAKNESLAAAGATLAKVFGGQETALRRAVPGLEKNAHGLDLIREAGKKLTGQAAANTTEAQKFAATLHDTEVIAGTALLPTLNKLLGEFGAYLDKLNRSGKLQKDVNAVVKDATGAFEALKSIIVPTASAFQSFGKAVGGTKNEVKLLAGAFAAFKAQKFLSELDIASGGVVGIGTKATTATSEVSGLRVALGRLAGIGLITIPIEILLNKGAIDSAVSGFLDKHGLPGGSNKLNAQQVLQQASSIGKAFGAKAENQAVQTAINQTVGPTLNNIEAFIKNLTGAKGFAVPKAGIPLPAHAGGIINAPLSMAQQLKIALAGRPDDPKLLQQQAARDRAAIAFAKKLRSENRISNAKFVDEVTGYQSDLASTLSTIAEVTKKAADAAKKNRAKLGLPGAISGSFADIGRHLTGLNLPGKISGSIPGEAFNLPKSLQLLAAKAGAGIGTDTHAASVIKAFDEQLLKSHRLSIQGQIDVYTDIAQQNSVLGTGAKSAFRHISSARFLNGLGLQGEALKTARARFDVLGANHTAPIPSPAFARSGGGTTINFHAPVTIGARNTRDLENEVIKRSRTRPQHRRS